LGHSFALFAQRAVALHRRTAFRQVGEISGMFKIDRKSFSTTTMMLRLPA
jgi:hypothetical protein